QPPLYKVTRGKKVQFLKDDDALGRYLIDRGSEGLMVTAGSGAVPLLGEPVQRLLEDIRRFRLLLAHMHRRGEPIVVEAYVRAAKLEVSQLADHEAVDAAVERMRAYLAQKRPDLGRVRFDVSRDEEHDRLQIEVTTRVGVA